MLGDVDSTSVSNPELLEPALTARIEGARARQQTSLHVSDSDYRAIDPPPILQLMMNDFDPNSDADLAQIRSPYWVVYCRLLSANDSGFDLSTQPHLSEDGRKEVQRLLLGTTVASPTLAPDDPDPPSRRDHPATRATSPSAILLPDLKRRRARQLEQCPAAFFIFADVSVRKAGDYKLQFTLMKMSEDSLIPGSSVRAIDIVTSKPFRAVNAKDFDQVHPSTALVKGLLERGAGFPLKLKKGTREGQRRKRRMSGDESDDSDSSD
jgi:hypothetical protein